MEALPPGKKKTTPRVSVCSSKDRAPSSSSGGGTLQSPSRQVAGLSPWEWHHTRNSVLVGVCCWQICHSAAAVALISSVSGSPCCSAHVCCFFPCYDGVTWQEQLKKGVLALAHSLRVQPTIHGKAWQQEHEATATPHLQLGGRDVNASTLPSPSSYSA